MQEVGHRYGRSCPPAWQKLAHLSVVAGFVALILCAGSAANVAGRRSYSVWQSAWYTCVAIVSMFFWAIAFDVVILAIFFR